MSMLVLVSSPMAPTLRFEFRLHLDSSFAPRGWGVNKHCKLAMVCVPMGAWLLAWAACSGQALGKCENFNFENLGKHGNFEGLGLACRHSHTCRHSQSAEKERTENHKRKIKTKLRIFPTHSLKNNSIPCGHFL